MDRQDAKKKDRPEANIGCRLNIAHCRTTYVNNDVMTAGVEQDRGRSEAQANTRRGCIIKKCELNYLNVNIKIQKGVEIVEVLWPPMLSLLQSCTRLEKMATH